MGGLLLEDDRVHKIGIGVGAYLKEGSDFNSMPGLIAAGEAAGAQQQPTSRSRSAHHAA